MRSGLPHRLARSTLWGLGCLLGLAACGADQDVEVPPGCGNGIVDEGEQCDPPNETGCSTACRILPSHLNACPELTFLFVSPRQTIVGEQFVVEASAEDPEGEKVLYRWEAPGGTFENPKKAATTYTCDEAGPRFLTLRYGDERGCENEETLEVRCLP